MLYSYSPTSSPVTLPTPTPTPTPTIEPVAPSSTFSDFNNFQLNGLFPKEELVKEETPKEETPKEELVKEEPLKEIEKEQKQDPSPVSVKKD